MLKQKGYQEEDTTKYYITINGISFWYADDIVLTEEIIRELIEFSDDYLEDNSYSFYFDDDVLVIY